MRTCFILLLAFLAVKGVVCKAGDRTDKQVHSEAGLSPGLYTEKYAEKCEQQRKRMQTRTQLPSCKRRRLVLKKERAVSMVAQETLEGASYQSGIGHEDNADIEKIPDPIPNGVFKPVHLTEEPTVIAFDLETTDLIRYGVMPHITQIAAVETKSGKTFSRYVTPTVPISSSAQQITGIVMNGTSMKVHGEPVESVPIKEALDSFCTWMESFRDMLLVAHNGRRFDFPVLIKAMSSVGYQERLFSCVSGCVDSLTVFQKQYPGRKTYKQEELASDLLNTVYGAHDAIEDVKVLGKLLVNTGITLSPENILKFSFAPKSVYQAQLFNKEKTKNIESLRVLVFSGVCKGTTAENIAGSGLNFRHLRLIYDRGGDDGLRTTFIMKNSEGRPRVTNTKRTLDTVIPALVDFFQKQ